jgi:methylmalonyl-CoA mutase, N-terminal domain
MTIPDFSTAVLAPEQGDTPAPALLGGQAWETPEGITVAPLYTAADLSGLDFLHTYPGIAPYLRGPYPTMYVNQPWTIRQYAGFSTAAESNAFYRRNLAMGQKGLSIAFDLPTHRGYDSDNPRVVGDVGMAGVAIDSIYDMRELFDGIPLDRITASHSLPAAFALAGQFVAARAAGLDPSVLRGSAIQSPMFGEDCSYATFMPFELRMRLCLDSMAFSTREMPRFHAFLEDTYFISDGGLDVVEEMALGFLEIREVTRRLVARGLPVDAFAPRIAILVNCRMDLFEEIAKVRATRRLYARMMRDDFGAQDPRSLATNVAVHTSGLTLTAAQPINNVVRGAVQAVAMAMAGVQGLEISTFDEAFRTPSHAAHVVAMRTQQVIAEETGVDRVADPLGGSWYVESLTDELERRVEAEVRRIEAIGDVGELVEAGFFREMFLKGMDRHAQDVQTGTRRVVGVNCHAMEPAEDTLLREVAEQRFEPDREHVERVRAWRDTRDAARVEAALAAVQDAAATPAADLMAPLVAALDEDCTIGEIAGALRGGYGLAADPFAG